MIFVRVLDAFLTVLLVLLALVVIGVIAVALFIYNGVNEIHAKGAR